MSEEKPKIDEPNYDGIFDYMSTFVLKVFKIKTEKWQKLLQGEEKNIICTFIDDVSISLISFTIGLNGILQTNIGFPSSTKNKIIYFIRQFSDIITEENMRMVLISGTVSTDLINELFIFTEEIVCPLLCNPQNHVNWPEVIIEDVKRHVADFKNNLCSVQGEIANQMYLPMPEGIENLKRAEEVFISSNGEMVDIYLKTNIEGIIIQWATQVNKALKETSEVIKEKNKFPTPMDEINYWKTRLKNLEGIYTQLRQLKVKKMAFYLEVTNSVYLQSFKLIMTNLIAGIVESRDIVIHQKPLIRHIEGIRNTNFLEIKSLIKPLIHCVVLLWTNSRYYCRIDRIVVFLQDISNLIIEQSTSSCNQKSIFFGEAFEQVIKIDQITGIINYFLKVYERYKQNIRSYFSDDTVPILWNFDNERVFSRLFAFLKRLKMVRHILQTTVEILKLEKVEFSGMRGKVLSEKTSMIFEKYNKLCINICDIECEPLNPEDNRFCIDFKKFENKVNHFDRCLAKLFGEAFDECFNLEHIFKFLQIVGDLVNRPIISKELQPRYIKIFSLFDEELSTVKGMFDEAIETYYKNHNKQMVDDHFPPIAGFLWWIFKLKQRISSSMMELTQHEKLIRNFSDYNVLKKKFDAILISLNENEQQHFEKWITKVPSICKKELDTPILAQDGQFIKLNFSYELKCLQREIKYLKYLDIYEIPNEGLHFYDQTENFESVISKLNQAIQWYNIIKKNSHESEITLIQKQLDEINDLLKIGLTKLNWNTDVTEYVALVYSKVNELQERVLLAQNNIRKVFDNIEKWSGMGMFDKCTNSKHGKSITSILNENLARKTRRYNDISTSNRELMIAIKSNYCLYFNIDEKDSGCLENISSSNSFNEIWSSYVEYIDNKVRVALTSAVSISLKIMISYMDSYTTQKSPFMEVFCELNDSEIKFLPNLEDDKDGIENIIMNMVDDILNQSSICKRVTNEDGNEDFLITIENDKPILIMKNRILDVTKATILDVKKYSMVYNKYSYLWIEDREDFLHVFLKYKKVLTYEIFEKMDFDKLDDSSKNCRPSLELFKNQIDIFEKLYKECDELPETKLFHGWLLLNMKGLKQTLLNYISKWAFVFKQDLINYVVKRLDDLDDFIENTINVLSIELKENDYDGLLCVMDCLINVREHQSKSTDEVFEPLKEHIELLKLYGVDFPEELYDEEGRKKHSVYTLLEVLPEKWKSLQKLAAVIRNNVAPLKINQSHLIVKQTFVFNNQMQMYYNDFKFKKFFSLNCENNYIHIDKTHQELMNFEEALVSLTKSCELFDVPPPDSKPIISARKELIMAKQIWDYYYLVEFTIEDWKKSPWKSIDAEGMDMECKRFTKDLKSLDKEIRNWEPYTAIECIIKNLLTSLRAVTELQNPAIKDRHWIELMQTTKETLRVDTLTQDKLAEVQKSYGIDS